MYRLTYLFIFFFSIVKTYAQTSIGFEGGSSLNKFHTILPDNARIRPNVGVLLGIPLEVKLNQHLYLLTEPEFAVKSYTLDKTGQFSGLYESFNNNYIQVPIKLGYRIGSKLKCLMEGGFYGGYWVTADIKGVIPDIYDLGSDNSLTRYDGKIALNTRNINRFQFGIISAIGCTYPIYSGFNIFFKTLLSRDLTNQVKSDAAGKNLSVNETIYFTSGIIKSFSFQKQFHEK
ncbi:outer membrane beta-barrel protein [Mucilaginibacter jinjuensis]|uniref:Outer membrane beta-barrel protein n=1 Tax=Mucilaginibacter jinjuensis TaxID=1176721 RepID=A0ABY7TDW4_9SPHI|nr:outer membrane beta-barrel protein [Mucilaginibacter jinjuensis]WCT14245.1 outer membrane beta-barrel protein [Mucilaginibacter jinjuensis]